MDSPTFVCSKCQGHVTSDISVCKCGDLKLESDNGLIRLTYSSDDVPSRLPPNDPGPDAQD